jgi:hypothetical protein
MTSDPDKALITKICSGRYSLKEDKLQFFIPIDPRAKTSSIDPSELTPKDGWELITLVREETRQ